MKREKGIYLVTFLCGVVVVNLFGNEFGVNSNILNRYSLATLTFEEIIFEEYFVQVLFLRLRTVMGLWILSRIFSRKIVSMGFAYVMCAVLGGIAAMCILANGLWGIWFFAGALFPHIICYGAAFALWSRNEAGYLMTGNRTEFYLTNMLILMFVGIGCILETYVSPILIKIIIKY